MNMSYFNPRAPYGARLVKFKGDNLGHGIFQSTRPIRGATCYGLQSAPGPSNFNPRAPYGARHSLRCPGDLAPPISIHAPHTGRDVVFCFAGLSSLQFQSTRPIRGATRRGKEHARARHNFNPRAPYGARRRVAAPFYVAGLISIHAPHTGRDLPWLFAVSHRKYFNPRAPYGARQ